MAISSVASGASTAASAAYARPRPPVDAKAHKDGEDAKAGETDDGISGLQAVHSVVAGTLGLSDPTIAKSPEEEHNGFYTAGKWLAAAGTIGTILSVLA